MKRSIILSFLGLCLLNAQELTKQEIFEQKYLKNKADMRSGISVEELYKNSKDFNLSSVDKQMKISSKDFNASYGNIEYFQNKKAENLAKELNKESRSKEFKELVNKNTEYILSDKGFDFAKYAGQYSQRTQAMINELEQNKQLLNNNEFLNPNEKIFIIISSSLKDETIKNYFKDFQNVQNDINFVLRGLVGNDLRYMKPTQEYMRNLMIKNPKGNLQDSSNYYSYKIEINPKITRKFKILKVPALLYIKNYNPIVQDYKEFVDKLDENEDYIVAYGEVKALYALEQINKKAKSDGLKRLIKAMSNSFYQ